MWNNLNPSGSGVYYSVMKTVDDEMEDLRDMFPDGVADEMNFCLFSTSGVHGTYATIEEVEEDMNRKERDGPRDITFLVVQPRIVCIRYGNCKPETADDIAFLKALRSSSHAAMAKIGM